MKRWIVLATPVAIGLGGPVAADSPKGGTFSF